MDSNTAQPATSATGTSSPPNLPKETLDAISAPRAPDAPRRCFICLTDEHPSDPPSSWVDPCPCTLEAHQDCMLSWVTDCERSSKPLRCPVCKSDIGLEGPWDPVVALADAVQRRFTHASPFMLFAGFCGSVQLSSQMYGAMAMWAFAGRDALLEFMFGPETVIDLEASEGLQFPKLGNASILCAVAPVLLTGQLMPNLSNKIFVPTASFYGMYHVMHDDHFVSWPPSPQLVMAVFPYIRSLYYNLWREFAFPYEMSLNRQLLGLPPAEPRQNNGGVVRENRRNAERQGDGGIIGFLQSVLDALDPDDEQPEGGNGAGINLQIEQEDVNEEEGRQDGDVMVEVIIEELAAEEAGDGEAGNEDADDQRVGNDQAQPPVDEPQEAAPAPQVPLEAPPANLGDQPQPDQNHEAPQAPPANRPGLGTIFSNAANALTSALILPGISFAVGEALRLTLPSVWTSAPGSYQSGRRLGLLQQQWGRSLIGGCLYVVMKDAIRLYAKHRRVAAMGNRRVKNVERERRKKNGGS